VAEADRHAADVLDQAPFGTRAGVVSECFAIVADAYQHRLEAPWEENRISQSVGPLAAIDRDGRVPTGLATDTGAFNSSGWAAPGKSVPHVLSIAG
jgi:hypothetical protein